MATKNTTSQRKSMGLGAALLAALLILVLTLAPVPVDTQAAANVQPALLAMAAEQPETQVRVIVQKINADADVSTLVAELGGEVVQDLSIINAQTVILSAGQIPKLGGSETVRWVSLDSAMEQSGAPSGCDDCIDTSELIGAYVQTIGASQLWNEPPYLQGQGVTVAIVDSGFAPHDDLNETTKKNSGSRLLDKTKFNSFSNSISDGYGHSTHIAGIIAGNGAKSHGAYIGVAPKVNFVIVKVSDDEGAGMTSDVINGLQWVLDHKDEHNIRVVNLSLNSSVAESYETNPLSAAVEILWFNGIVVVASSGNNGSGLDNGILYPPANDPFIITVGATDDQGTPSLSDDVLASFSAYGITADGFNKPDIVAPGTDIISLLLKGGDLVKKHPQNRVDGFAGGKDYYYRMSGTSMATAVTSGAIALLLQDEPGLTPDQVKYRLMATAAPFNGPEPGSTGAGYLDIYAAVHGDSVESANTGIAANQLLWTGNDPVQWGSVNWGSVNWGSVNWGSVNWGSVNWGSVNWGSVSWDD